MQADPTLFDRNIYYLRHSRVQLLQLQSFEKNC